MASPASRAGTARRGAPRSFRWRSTRWRWPKSSRCSSPPRPRAGCLFALLHDAPEYVIGDMISPFKAALGDSYRQVEARLAQAILQRFSLNPQPPPALQKLTKRADRISAFFEATLYAGFDEAEARTLFGEPKIPPARVAPWFAPRAPEAAQAEFLQKFAEVEQNL